MEKLLLTVISAFIVCLLLGPSIIGWLRNLKFGQSIRQEGPQSHLKKSGIPTMGGIIILLALVVTTFIFAPNNPQALICLGVTFFYGLIGFLDDFIIVVKKRSLGLTARQKLLAQILGGLFLGTYIWFSPVVNKEILLPFTELSLDLGYLYIPFVILVMIGTSNAVNLTDGLDGLAAGTTAVALLAYLFITTSLGNFGLAVFTAGLLGACLGFLWFNCHPAQVFMGDTGSLALGGALASIAVLTGTEVFLLIIGGLFVIETLSVIIQVISFKLTGRRIFRMSPIHHHFELSGWKETKVVARFYLVAILFALLGAALFLS